MMYLQDRAGEDYPDLADRLLWRADGLNRVLDPGHVRVDCALADQGRWRGYGSGSCDRLLSQTRSVHTPLLFVHQSELTSHWLHLSHAQRDLPHYLSSPAFAQELGRRHPDRYVLHH